MRADQPSTSPNDPRLAPILAAIQQALPPQRPLSLHEPCFTGSEWEKLKDCLDSGWVSSVGRYVDRFEEMLGELTGLHAVCTVNGTAALHACLHIAGVQAGDEVLLPALTFVGTANPVAYSGAVPHFVDADPATLGVDPDALSDYLADIAEPHGEGFRNRHSGRPLRALIVVHVLGHPARMDRLQALAEQYRLVLIEDAAESLGSEFHDRHTGHWGRLTALSFNGNKVVTTGGGGAILCADAELAKRAKHLTTTAKLPHAWGFEHDEVAFNYRLPNLNAALGCAQLEALPELLERKRELAERYAAACAGLEGARFFYEPERTHSNYWLNLLLLEDPALRDPLLEALHAEELLARPFWTPLHRLPMFTEAPRAPLPVAENLFARGVCLPSSAQLVESEP